MKILLWVSFAAAWVFFAAWRFYGAPEFFQSSILSSVAFTLCWLVGEYDD